MNYPLIIDDVTAFKTLFKTITTVSASLDGSSHPKVFCKEGVLRKFTKFTGKHLCQSPFFNKIAGLSSVTSFKKTLWHRCFPVNFAKFLTLFPTEHIRWLLLPRYVNGFIDNFSKESKDYKRFFFLF